MKKTLINNMLIIIKKFVNRIYMCPFIEYLHNLIMFSILQQQTYYA